VSGRAPEHGVRFELLRESGGPGAEIVYRGAVYLGLPYVSSALASDRAVPIVVRLDGEASVVAELLWAGADGRGRELAKVAEALVRAATRSCLRDGRSVPNRITRWRA